MKVRRLGSREKYDVGSHSDESSDDPNRSGALDVSEPGDSDDPDESLRTDERFAYGAPESSKSDQGFDRASTTADLASDEEDQTLKCPMAGMRWRAPTRRLLGESGCPFALVPWRRCEGL